MILNIYDCMYCYVCVCTFCFTFKSIYVFPSHSTFRMSHASLFHHLTILFKVSHIHTFGRIQFYTTGVLQDMYTVLIILIAS